MTRAKDRTYTKYADVCKGLGSDVSEYLNTLKTISGLADWKLAHDLSADSGVEVKEVTARYWRHGGGGASA